MFQVTVYTTHAKPLAMRKETLSEAVALADTFADNDHLAEVTDPRDGTWNDSVQAYYCAGNSNFRACYR